MARIQKAKGKIVRRLGVNIFGNAKFDKALKKKPYIGQQKKTMQKKSDYAIYLFEKQKVRFAYGLSEKQFANNFEKAKKLKGITGHNMLILLERRLDNVIYRIGFAPTRSAARQMVGHGHIHVNGRRLNIPSALVRLNDTISVKDSNNTKTLVRKNLSAGGNTALPEWLILDKDGLSAKVNSYPTREMIQIDGNEQFIVEWYSK